MKKSSKVILIALCAVALVCGSIFGTLAYLTDDDAVVNTFTVGKIDISFDELDTDSDDNADDNVTVGTTIRDKANAYHLLPGHSYVKDPTVHVTKGSEACYVFVTVDNRIADIEWNDDNTSPTIAEQMAAKGWTLLVDDGGAQVKKDGLSVYSYAGPKSTNGVVPKNTEADTDLTVFETFRIDGSNVIARGDATGDAPTGFFYLDDYATVGENGKAITVKAYAVQADGFANAYAAWDANF